METMIYEIPGIMKWLFLHYLVQMFTKQENTEPPVFCKKEGV